MTKNPKKSLQEATKRRDALLNAVREEAARLRKERERQQTALPISTPKVNNK